MIQKAKILLLFLMTLSSGLLAQQLTKEEKAVFDEIVYKRQKVGEYEKLSKWATPIRYKIYGDTSSYLVKEVEAFFNQLKTTTSLDIQRTTNSSEENFMIVFGKDPVDFQPFTLTKTPLTSFGSYRIRMNKSNEIYWGQSLINTKLYGSRTNIKNALKKHIVRCLGFIKDSELAPNSIFNTKNQNDIKVDEFDLHIISTLYLPAIKAGMTKDEVDAALKLIGN